MALTISQINEQKKQAEELLSDNKSMGFAKSLFFGKFKSDLIFPYPQMTNPSIVEKAKTDMIEATKHIDASSIDVNSEIPQEVIDRLADLGVLGMTAPKEYGGRGFSQLEYCEIMKIIGGHCASTAVFVNAHHSIGIRALVLFGTTEQKKKWLPDLVSGKKLAAFALTEPEAGSDAGNVQTTATLSEDRKHYILNGQKRYITNGAIAGVLTLMARTQVPNSKETKVTAFLVTPDMAGFKVVEARMQKCGIRGTATARLAFENMKVPVENVLGEVGKGLKVALTVLDFGRTTFGASCSGAAKVCVKAATNHANNRIQFKQKLGEFELVKKKLAFMSASAFAMESMTSQCASFIDKGADDYMLETAMLKVFTTEALWTIINDTMQIFGGQGYFSNEPYERMMRDARINLIGEGANDVLKAFIAVVGLKSVGEHLKGILVALHNPIKNYNLLLNFGKDKAFSYFATIPVKNKELKNEAKLLASNIKAFGFTIERCLVHFRNEGLKYGTDEMAIIQQVLKSQYIQERLSDIVCDLYASSCVLSRLEHENSVFGKYFLTLANRRIKQNMDVLWDNDDKFTTKTANELLK